ncbi:hypothetical protein VB776_08610 [Arcicella sp. DC2W]|uniref:Transposase n=1 Tax=Arcicella gelida TaxID=2984195 RepID=A0ABU5S396_9BACT|nr:hypothetical protein [Arcicella sp. DC2W]MEA5402973.1 hypothetical protein [Arcicella sp. DC2W]
MKVKKPTQATVMIENIEPINKCPILIAMIKHTNIVTSKVTAHTMMRDMGKPLK